MRSINPKNQEQARRKVPKQRPALHLINVTLAYCGIDRLERDVPEATSRSGECSQLQAPFQAVIPYRRPVSCEYARGRHADNDWNRDIQVPKRATVDFHVSRRLLDSGPARLTVRTRYG